MLTFAAMLLLSSYRLWMFPEGYDPRYVYRWVKPIVGLSTLGAYYLVLAALLAMRYNVFPVARWTGWVMAAALVALLPASCIAREDGVPIILVFLRYLSLEPVIWLVLLLLQISLVRSASRALEREPERG